MKWLRSLGSDCPFFLYDQTMMMEGRGEMLSPSSVHLEGLWLVLLFPEIHISTAEAYAGVKPVMPEHHLKQLLGDSHSIMEGKCGQ